MIPRPIRWAAGAGRRFRRTGAPVAASPRGAQDTAGRLRLCDVFWDVAEPDDDELAPQPAAARTAVSATAPSTPGLAARPGRLWDRRVNNVSLTSGGPRRAVPARGEPSASPCAVNAACLAISLRLPGRFLSGGPGLAVARLAIRRLGRLRSGHAFHAGGLTRTRQKCPGASAARAVNGLPSSLSCAAAITLARSDTSGHRQRSLTEGESAAHNPRRGWCVSGVARPGRPYAAGN